MLDELRTRLVPALENLLDTFGHNLGPQIIDTVSELVRLLGNLSSAASPLSILATTIAGHRRRDQHPPRRDPRARARDRDPPRVRRRREGIGRSGG
jgi:hypothetical protein